MAMSDREFSVPSEIEEILDRLPPGVTLNVPEHVLLLWFPPAAGDDGMDQITLRAQSYAQSCGCKFAYHARIREGIFFRLAAPKEI
jgi:hypothetical protein